MCPKYFHPKFDYFKRALEIFKKNNENKTKDDVVEESNGNNTFSIQADSFEINNIISELHSYQSILKIEKYPVDNCLLLVFSDENMNTKLYNEIRARLSGTKEYKIIITSSSLEIDDVLKTVNLLI